MSSKVTGTQAKNSTQAYEVAMALFGDQKPGSREAVIGVWALAGNNLRMSVTEDEGFEVRHVWVRFSQERAELHARMLGDGWHWSPKNRKGYHRVADAQAEALVKALLVKATQVPASSLVKAVEKPVTQAPAKSSTPAGKTGKKGGKGGIKAAVGTQAGAVTSAQEVATTPAPTGKRDFSDLTTLELLDKAELYTYGITAVMAELRKRQ